MRSLTAIFWLAGVLGLLAPVRSVAQSVATTPPAGFVNLTIPASADFLFGAPLINAPVFAGVIASCAGNVITLTQTGGQPNWATNAFVYNAPTQTTTYYALITSGAEEGLSAPIQANGANTLTVNLGVQSLAAVNSGDSIAIVPYWTLGALFPNVPNGTQLLVFNGGIPGVNLSASTIYTFYQGNGWYDGGTLSTNTVLDPAEAVIIRNNSTSSINLTITGNVPVNNQYAIISTLAANQAQDNPFSYLSPAPVSLGASGLGFNNQDQLLVFNNTGGGYNQSASSVLTYYAGRGWYDGGTNVDTSFTLQPGNGYIYRAAATAAPVNLIWQSAQPYLPLQ
jgi:uncharacterized protein (TIGR02597 family)